MTVGTLAPLMKSELNLNFSPNRIYDRRYKRRFDVISGTGGFVGGPFRIEVDHDRRSCARWGFRYPYFNNSLVSPDCVYSVLLRRRHSGKSDSRKQSDHNVVSTKGRATGMGIKQTGVSMGGILGPVLLPMVAWQCGSWRQAFVFAGTAAIGTALMISILYRDPADYQTGFQEKHGIGSDMLQLLGNRDFVLVCFVGIFLMVTQFSLMAYLMLYASNELGLSLGKSGFLVSLLFIGGFLGRVGWSVASDYLFKGRRNIVLVVIGAVGTITTACFIGAERAGSNFPMYLLTILLGLTVWDGMRSI
jgi:hypothetical protein